MHEMLALILSIVWSYGFQAVFSRRPTDIDTEAYSHTGPVSQGHLFYIKNIT